MVSATLALALAAGPAADAEPVEPPVDTAAIEQENEALRREAEALKKDHARTEKKVDELERENAELRETVEKDNAELRKEMEELREAQARTDEQVEKLRPLQSRLQGYVDVGFFRVAGDGSGIRPDRLNRIFPEYAGEVSGEWVLMGDPLSTAINSRGDVADTGLSRAIRQDPIGAGANPTIIVNALNLNPNVAIGDQFAVDGLIDFLPRPQDISAEGNGIGDLVDVKRAEVRWIPPAKRFDLDVYVGKIDSVFGREYKYQESPQRTTVTPSLICRYTCGRPVGLSTRWKFLPSRRLHVNLALTNGGTVKEFFGFASEIDSNAFKTVTSRVAFKAPVGAGLTFGMSGQVGAQDLQPRNERLHWQWGADVHLDVRGFELTGEFIQVQMQGRTAPGEAECGLAPCLQVLGAYGLAGYRVLNWLMPYFRTDWRDALHRKGAEYIYISQLVRFTPGLRFEVGPHVVLKAEYTFNRELGRIPQFHNDIFTSSLVAGF